MCLLPRRSVEVDSAALLEAQLAETATKLKTELLIFEEGLVSVTTHFKIGPLLVDLLLSAIHDLLDLLVLHMGLD